MSKSKKIQEGSPPDTIRFHYIKGNHFRVIHVDGAHGGITPNGGVHMAMYNERNPIPLRTTHLVDGSGRLAKETERVMRDGIVREVEIDATMSIETAETIAKWLMEKVKQAKTTVETK